MDRAAHNHIVSFIWGTAADVLRDLLQRGNCEFSADILAIEKWAEGLPDGLFVAKVEA